MSSRSAASPGESSGAPSEDELQRLVDRSEMGAPAAGRAVRDIFSTDEIFERITATADEEFQRPTRLLFLSGVAAGLSIALSFVARAALTGATPMDSSGLIGNLLYPLGFLLIVGGRYQLFTENTLTPVTLVLTRIASVPLLLRVWVVVLAANVLGAGIMAFVLANTGVLNEATAEAARAFGHHALEVPTADLFWKGVFAGWIVASMVWLTHAARDATARILIVFLLMYLIPSADLFHCIIGACEVLFLWFQGEATLWACVSFFGAVVAGNTVGGVLLVGILNFAQTRDARFPDRDCGQLQLTWSEWLFGLAAGGPGAGTDPSRPFGEGPRELDTPPSERDHVQGPADAEVALVQYGDYECPTSRLIYLQVRRAMRRMDGDARYVYRHLPLSQQHPHAQRAACAAEAAGRQSAFWEMHDQLFSHQDRLGEEDLVHYASDLELELDRFRKDMGDEACEQRVDEDRSSGIRSGVRESDNLFIDGYRYRGEMTADAIARAARRIRRRAVGLGREPI